jgi:hypothetical protein
MSGLWAQARKRDEQPQYHPSLALEPEKRKKSIENLVVIPKLNTALLHSFA